MIYNERDTAQAVMFLGRNGVVKELLFPEFQSILDGFVPLEDWSERTAKAVYLELNNVFCATAAVFFTLSFDKRGAVERLWNLPLLDLARTSARGPDMGAGPIRLVCQSQCPVALFKDFLWNPDLKPSGSHLVQIKKALKRNKLNLVFKAEPNNPNSANGGGLSSAQMREMSQRMGESYQKELRDQVAQLLKDQRLQIATMSADKDQAVNEVRLEYLKKFELLQNQLEIKTHLLEETLQQNDDLNRMVAGQVQKIEGLREYFERKLERGQGADSARLDAVRRESELEAQAKIELAMREAQEHIRMKDAELIFRREHEEALEKQLKALRDESQQLIEKGGDFVLEALSRKGVNFVTYQPGAGHITIPLTQIPLFMESPIAFTAGYCGVSEKHYALWLKHYQTPVCQAVVGKNQLCGADLERISNPVEFVDGESNYCHEHNRLKSLRAVKS